MPRRRPAALRPDRRGARARADSVAVLYFDNLSRDTADAFLADGLTEELIIRLGQVQRAAADRPALRVVATAVAVLMKVGTPPDGAVSGAAELIRNKRATGRRKDLGDLETLGELPPDPA